MIKWIVLEKIKNNFLITALLLIAAPFGYATECHMGIRGSEGGSSNLTMSSYSNSIRWARTYGPGNSTYTHLLATAEMDLDPWLESQCDAGNDGEQLISKIGYSGLYRNLDITDYTAIYKTNVPGIGFSVKIYSDAGGGYFDTRQSEWTTIDPGGNESWAGKRWKAHIEIYQIDIDFAGNTGGATYLTPSGSYALGQMGIGDPSDSDNKPWTFTVTPSSFQIPIIATTCQTVQLDTGSNNIDLGEYMVSDFNASPRSTSFMVQLLGCNNVTGVDFKMNAQNVTGTDNSLLGNTLTGAGAAEGVGVKLMSTLKYQQITPNNVAYSFYNIDTGSGVGIGALTFDAQLVKNGATLKAGNFKGQATFTLSYH
ncbi:fimbrial protein [uncultured Enterobacter sp.]|uniref:fimbrial protein n=1 Tax=uncultured Enterobacter sp. TaxID=238202 RepID=UPI0025D7B64D|nr:fimbrial protein [uncultured Enterobacter sp.]